MAEVSTTPAPEQHSSSSNDDNDIECAQRPKRQCLMDVSYVTPDDCDDKPKVYETKLCASDFQSYKRALKIPGISAPLPKLGENGKLDMSDSDEDWSTDESISDFQDPPSDENPIREVPVDTFVKSTRRIYADGRVEYLASKEKK